MNPKKPKSYIVQTIVEANSAEEALKIAKKSRPTSVFLENPQPDNHRTTDAIGFKVINPND